MGSVCVNESELEEQNRLEQLSSAQPNRQESKNESSNLSENRGLIAEFIDSYRGLPSSKFAYRVSQHAKLTPIVESTLSQIKSASEHEQGGPKIPDLSHKIYYVHGCKATYQGNFVRGMPDGEGIVHFMDGSFFYGRFENGDARGNGIYIFKDGSVYEGWLEESSFNGFGSLCYQNNRIKYIGFFLKGKPHGKGEELYENGEGYAGQFNAGVKEGKGIYIWTNGQIYEGEFKHGLMNGNGKITKGGTVAFQGYFLQGKREGRGLIIRNDCSVEGNFVNDQLQGLGSIYWKDGTIYQCTFKRSKLQGNGHIYDKGKKWNAQWRNNELTWKEEMQRPLDFEAIIKEFQLKHKVSGQ